jgi:hypothetical protein
VKVLGRRSAAALVAAISLVVLGCGNGATSSNAASSPTPVSEWKNVSAGTIRAGDPIPAPEDEPILSISGLVSNTNRSDEITVDLTTLEKMPLIQFEVVEPFEERNMTFEGVPIADLMEIAGAGTGANELHVTALDDYEFTIPLEVIRETKVLLATKAQGEHMTVADGGPTRIIFPPDSQFGQNPNAWVWSVETIDVR